MHKFNLPKKTNQQNMKWNYIKFSYIVQALQRTTCILEFPDHLFMALFRDKNKVLILRNTVEFSYGDQKKYALWQSEQLLNFAIRL